MTELSLTGLRVLREVAERGSFTAAAKTLGYTQSAISRQVASLERAAEAPLFERTARGVRLTDAGAALSRHAGTVLDQVDAARRELEGMSERATGRIRVGAFPTAVASLVPRTLAEMRRRHPAVDASLREGGTQTHLKALASGSVDVAVIGVLPGARSPGDRGIRLEALVDDPLLLAVSARHRLAGRRTVEIDDLADESWVAATPKASDTLIGAWQWADWQPQVEMIAKDWTAKLGLVAAGLGVTLVPGLAADAVRPDVALVRIRSDRPVNRRVLIATRSGRDQPVFAVRFEELLHETAAEMTAELQRRIRR
jgi:DNA-binding transcriptional LysR family regulator